MSQIQYLKFLEHGLVHSKYDMDSNYFLKTMRRGERDKLILSQLGLWACGYIFVVHCFLRLLKSEHWLSWVRQIPLVSGCHFLCGQDFVSCSCVGIKTQVVRVLRWLPSLLLPQVVNSICSSSGPSAFPFPLFLAVENFPLFRMSLVLHSKDYVLHIRFIFL